MKRAIKIVGIIGFDGANAFDIVGPLEAFYTAGRSDGTDRDSRGSYEVVVAGLSREAFTAESGVRLVPHCRLVDAPRLDTVIVPGGPGLRERRTNEAVVAWLLANAERCRRVAKSAPSWRTNSVSTKSAAKAGCAISSACRARAISAYDVSSMSRVWSP